MPNAKDLSHLLSTEAKNRKSSPLKDIIKYKDQPGMRSLGGGLPIPELFPFDNIEFQSPSVPFSKGVALEQFDPTEIVKSQITRAIRQPKQEDVELATSLQYGHSLGENRLIEFISEHTKRVHNIAYDDWQIILTCGNTFSWDACLRTFTNPGDTILVEEFAFSSALECATSRSLTPVGVKMDLYGIIPEAFEEQLANWVGPKPKLLYTVPTGQNPTGSSLSADRRQKVYEIACKYDFVIIEDEPYYYLQFPQYERGATPKKQTNEEMVKNLVPSFLDFDTEGRVLRLDSFSKVIAPGTRLGWVVAQPLFIERLCRLHETTIQAPSGFSTSIVYGALRRWGQEGYLTWLNELKDVYRHQRNIACDAIFEHFPEGKFDFVPPVAGMFYWFKVDARRYKNYATLGSPEKCEDEIWHTGIKRNVLVVPGHWFVAKGKTNPPQPELPVSEADAHAMYFRGTFAGVSPETLREALTEFGALLNEILD